MPLLEAPLDRLALSAESFRELADVAQQSRVLLDPGQLRECSQDVAFCIARVLRMLDKLVGIAICGDELTKQSSIASQCAQAVPFSLSFQELPSEQVVPAHSFAAAASAKKSVVQQAFPRCSVTSEEDCASIRFNALPATLTLKSADMLLTSRLGDILERRNYLPRLVLLLTIINLVWYHALLKQEVYQDLGTKGRQIQALVERPDEFSACCLMISCLLQYFLIAHRYNRAIVLLTFAHAETVIISGGILGASVLSTFSAHYLLGDSSDAAWILVDIALALTIQLPLAFFVATNEALMIGPRSKVILLSMLVALWIFLWVHSRCFAESWGPPPSCTLTMSGIEGINAREMVLACYAQIVVFMSKALISRGATSSA